MIHVNSIDPRTKLFFVAMVSSIAIITNDIMVLIGLFVLSIVALFLLGGFSISLFYRFRKLLFVILAIALVQSFFTSQGSSILQIGEKVILTDFGILRAVQFALRITIVIISSLILITSSSRNLIQGLLQFKIPYEIVFMLSIAAKFLPILRDEMVNKVIAMQLRGIDFNRIGLRKKIALYRYLLFPVTINSLLKSKDMSVAMEMRGFRAMDGRTSYRSLKMKNVDYIIIFFSLIIGLSLVVFKIVKGGI